MEPNNTTVAVLDARVPGWREMDSREIIGALCAALEGPVLLEGWLRKSWTHRSIAAGGQRSAGELEIGLCEAPRVELISGTAPTLEAAMLDAVRRARGEG